MSYMQKRITIKVANGNNYIHAKGLYEAIKEDKTYLVEIFRSHLEISELNASVVLLSRFSDDLKSVRKLCNSKKMFISYNNYYKSS